jgi:IS5 family transposase
MFKESDESLVLRWIENAFGNILLEKIFFETKRFFDLSEFVYFRKRLKEKGLEFILSQTVELNSEAKIRKEV